MRLLLIEDDELLGDGLRDYLRADGHNVDWARSLAEAGACRGEPFDAWLVDWQLPDGSGLDWLRQRRSCGERTPALMLTPAICWPTACAAWTLVLTTTSSNPSPPKSWRRACVRCAGAAQAVLRPVSSSARSKSTSRRAAPGWTASAANSRRANGRCWKR